jgi:hypothetical protein
MVSTCLQKNFLKALLLAHSWLRAHISACLFLALIFSASMPPCARGNCTIFAVGPTTSATEITRLFQRCADAGAHVWHELAASASLPSRSRARLQPP